MELIGRIRVNVEDENMKNADKYWKFWAERKIKFQRAEIELICTLRIKSLVKITYETVTTISNQNQERTFDFFQEHKEYSINPFRHMMVNRQKTSWYLSKLDKIFLSSVTTIISFVRENSLDKNVKKLSILLVCKKLQNIFPEFSFLGIITGSALRVE